MSTTESDADGIGRLLAREFGRSFRIGIDTDGYRHHFYRPADTVVVWSENGVEHYRYLDGRTVSEWDMYVAQERGWRSHGPFASLGISEDLRRKGGGE